MFLNEILLVDFDLVGSIPLSIVSNIWPGPPVSFSSAPLSWLLWILLL